MMASRTARKPSADSNSSEPTPILGRNSVDIPPSTLDHVAKTSPAQAHALTPGSAENGLSTPRNASNGRDGHAANGNGADHDESSPLLGDPNTNEPEAAPKKDFLLYTHPTRFWFIFIIILAGLFITSFDGTIMSTSHPIITSEFHAANSASWLSTAYFLTGTAFQPLLGRLSDAVGRKPLFVGCLAVFTLSTVWCALAGSIGSFIAARAVCGLGAGGSGTLGSILTSDLVPIERRGMYQALINITVGIGGALGAALGGALAEALGWRWEFGVQLPFLVLCTIVAAVTIPSNIGLQDGRKSARSALSTFDVKGSILLSGGLTFLTLALSLGGNVLSWSHPLVITSLVVFGIAAPTFVWVETKVEKPVMPLRLLSHTPRANIIFSNFISTTLINAIFFNLPLYFQTVLLSSATDSGLRLVVPSVIASVSGAATGILITWSRRLKWAPVWGSIGIFVGCVSMSLMRRGLSDFVYLLILVPSSIGQGFAMPGSFMALLASSEQKEQAVVTSALILWRSLGLVIGVAYSSLVVQNALLHYLHQYVTGPDAAEIISMVRGSVDAVSKIKDPVVQEQVIMSYEAALRLTFITCSVLGAVSVLLNLPMKLPRLPKRD